MEPLPELVDDLPDICGREDLIAEAVAAGTRASPGYDASDLDRATAAFSIALHMHQPLIPAGPDGSIVSNLGWMMDHPDVADNHDAPVFIRCYERMSEIVGSLLAHGGKPAVMLDYSGTLLYGLHRLGLQEVFDALSYLTHDTQARRAVEWLGCSWGHAVAPSTPVQDYRLHVRAWQHHFASIFGLDALGRVRGFSPAEMALPNHPDIAYEFVRTLRECGYDWTLVQEHTVEQPDGRAVDHPHLPHRLVCRNSRGDTAAITAIVKTQGSDTKLVGQMQPYYEAKTLVRQPLAGRSVPPLVTQIADGENGGVIMNEFPSKYRHVIDECTDTSVPAVTVSAYLEALARLGVDRESFPPLQPVLQHRLWQRFTPGETPERLTAAITALRGEDDRFHMDGGSWTGDISWVRGYANVLAPMERASSLFNQNLLAPAMPTDDPRYRRALFLLLTCQTSCYRYWGQGVWTDYGTELAQRAAAAATAAGRTES